MASPAHRHNLNLPTTRTLQRLTIAFLLALAACHSQTSAAQGDEHNLSNPVLPGDHPDPSLIRVGKTYWMTSTSGDWSPQFALYRSKDLQHWKAAGAVFPHQPAWATGSFWAPEIVNDNGKILVYYVGRKHDGPLCVAVATADKPEGPFTDHGPIVCQPDGSIDPAFIRDESGKPYLVWKEDGNSEQHPTPIWAQPLTPDLTQLTDDKTQLIVNEPETWERGVVEAPYLLRHGGSFYMFYAGNACCGNQCNYAEGVARAPSLLGPWEKGPANPIIRPNGTWRCPGHGSAVQSKSGKDYFLYHAYPIKGTIYLGRESVLDQITWNADGWPVINNGNGPGETPPHDSDKKIADSFKSDSLNPEWRWPVNHEPQIVTGSGSLTLTVSNDQRQDFVARSLNRTDYTAEVRIRAGAAALGSLAVIGNARNATGLGRQGDTLELWKQGEDGRQSLWHADVKSNKDLHLRVTSTAGTSLVYAYSLDGKHWTPAGEPIDVSKLPQWDQGLRVGLMVEGSSNQTTTFKKFVMKSR